MWRPHHWIRRPPLCNKQQTASSLNSKSWKGEFASGETTSAAPRPNIYPGAKHLPRSWIHYYLAYVSVWIEKNATQFKRNSLMTSLKIHDECIYSFFTHFWFHWTPNFPLCLPLEGYRPPFYVVSSLNAYWKVYTCMLLGNIKT